MTSRHLGCALGVACSFAGTLGFADAALAASKVRLAAHRAVYDMTLGVSRNSASVTGVRGRMVYEITGNACEGWTQNMRLVTEMSTTEGQPTVSDMRSSTWEDGVANLFRFSTSQLRDQKSGDATKGDAKREANGTVAVELTQPSKATINLPAGTVYPVQHSIALLDAALAGKTTMRADLYDGSEKGDKAYDTLARIGRKADPAAIKALPAMKGATSLDALAAWPVSISYFEPGKDKTDATPVYELSFLFFENGISRKLVIDYGDFSIKGEITDLEMLDAGKCEPK